MQWHLLPLLFAYLIVTARVRRRTLMTVTPLSSLKVPLLQVEEPPAPLSFCRDMCVAYWTGLLISLALLASICAFFIFISAPYWVWMEMCRRDGTPAEECRQPLIVIWW